MPTNEAEVPPQRIWTHRYDDGSLKSVDQKVETCGSCVPYVPASALEAVWETALAAVRKIGNNIASGEDYNEFHGLIVDVIMALEAARDAALSAGKGATSEDADHE